MKTDKNQIIRILKQYREELKDFGVKSLSLFGSVVRGEEMPESDVDILVEFDPTFDRIGLFAFIRLRYRLEELLGRKVDLVTPDALKPKMKSRISTEAVYGT